MEPRVQYTTTSDGISIAFAVVGTGSPVVLFPEPGVSLIEAAHIPEWAPWLEALGANHQVLLTDQRGFGHSELSAVVTSADEMVEDIRAVVTTLGLPPFALLARGPSCKVALKFAIELPDRVSHLILVGPNLGQSDLLDKDGPAEGGVAIQSMWDLWVEERVAGTKHLCHADRDSRRKFADIARGGSPGKLQAVQDAFASVDGHTLADAVDTPTLVLVDEAETDAPQEEMRRAAAAIPGAIQGVINLGSWMLFEDSNHQVIEKLDAFLASPAVTAHA